MPAISKIRFTNVIYESGGKRYNDDIFYFDGHNGAILLENGGGKTVFVQTAIQAVLPHSNLAERKIRETLSLEGSPCHIAIEWILNEKPRKYAVTAVTLFLRNNKLDSLKYAYEYNFDDEHSLENLPFVKEVNKGMKRPASKGEMTDYYQYMDNKSMNAKIFKTIRDYHEYIEENYKIIPSEWRNIAMINGAEGGVEDFFEGCKTNTQLVDKLLIPVVEEAILEKNTKDFIDTFEKQREHFKKHKQLRDRIEESKQIDENIDQYVKIFDDYHNINQHFIEKKQYVKSIYSHMKNEEINVNQQLIKNKREMENIQNLLKELNRKEASLELAVLKEELENKKIVFKNAETNFNEVKYNYDNKHTRLNNLKIAQFKYEIKELEDRIKNNKEQLERLQNDIDLEEIKEEIEENASKLKAYFLSEEEDLSKKKIEKENQERLYKDKKVSQEKKLDELKKMQEDLVSEIQKNKGESNQIKRQLDRTIKRLPSLSPNDDIKKEQQNWRNKIGQLEKLIAENNNNIKDCENKKQVLEDEIKDNRGTFNTLEKEKVVLDNKIQAINEKEENLLLKIKNLNKDWDYIDSIYTKQSSIVNYIINKIENLINEKEKLLLEERIAGRHKDDYEESSYFTPEPLVEKWINNWKNQFKYIETGTQYIQRAAKTFNLSENEFVDKYLYWPISIIVHQNEVQLLKEKIDKNRSNISNPILILGESDASKLINEGNNPKEILVFPKHWEKNMNQDFFENWKQEIQYKLEKITENRRKKENEITEYKQCLRDLTDFFKDYTYEYYQDLRSEKTSIEEKLYSLSTKIKNDEEKISNIKDNLFKYTTFINTSKDEVNVLNQWVQYAQDYILRSKERESLLSLIEELKTKLKKIEIDIKVVERDLNRIIDALLYINKNINEFKNRINNLISDSLYLQVKNAKPTSTSTSKSGLVDERKKLQDILYEKQGDIKYLYDYIDNDQKNKRDLLKKLEMEKDQSDYPIDEDLIFPSYGEEEIKNLISELNDLKLAKKKAETTFIEKSDLYKGQLKKYEIYKEQFLNKYEQIIIFTQQLYHIKISIDNERKDLNNKEEKNKVVYLGLSKQKDVLDKGLNTLLIKDGKYRYLSENIKLVNLTEDFLTDFQYDTLTLINRSMEELEKLYDILEKSKQRLNYGKNKFIIFCNEKIKDPRLRERTIAGVQSKNTYNEVIEWKNKMKINITHTIKIAEDDMREHDKELEQFIEYLFAYLSTLVKEISIIPKKTRIKVEDKWKEIYRFNIPEWKEEEGKQDLRKHVDWMIRELENNEFINEDGTENSTNIRKEIEKWLDSRQLLPMLLKNKPIKISCRKVTNDGRISSSLTSWESSNRWSGGEKWSKNMTLFLGILNYLAEKRQSLITANKKNRTVIVDNPFGKASSDHVLDPVFFIAEKLGFQMIALTAHTEGSFIRNYFPVVYSCRLRESSNNSTLILDKEKEIHYAFFRDNAPESINRLEEKKQLTLFN